MPALLLLFAGEMLMTAPPDPVVAIPEESRPKGAVILVSDQQLDDLTDPDKPVDLSLSPTPRVTSLREVCRQARDSGARTLVLTFDAFWEQYRPGQKGRPRDLTPDSDEYIDKLLKVSRTLNEYGLGLELGLLTPLEIGAAYAKRTGEPGRWVQYREGWRDPRTGQYTLTLWQQLQWTNNKGTIAPQRVAVRAYAFRERRLGDSYDYRVDPAEIVPLRQAPEVSEASPSGPRQQLTIRGSGDAGVGPLDRVMVVVEYQTPEMDYFSPGALPFLTGLVDRYHAAGIPLAGLYCDEPHIQADWGYFSHHDEGEFCFRYLTPGLARRYAERYGAEYADFEKYLVYFCYGQHGFLPGIEARAGAQHVLGDSAVDLQRTILLRRRYYDLLDRTVVDLFTSAKRHAEQVYARPLRATMHATWAQSPTIDAWHSGEPAPDGRNRLSHNYEYTPNFVWSNTVHQAAAACSDYFRWGEFLTGGGTDHAEGGWSDRDYYGLALAASIGTINAQDPYAYAAGWGWPHQVGDRYAMLANAYGDHALPEFQAIEGRQHRDTDVLMLYPLSLVAAEERFGSWMTQYGYANLITPEKLLELGKVAADGRVELCGRRYGTLAALFEPLPPPGLLPFLEDFVQRGGRLVWSGPPPRLDFAGADVLPRWQALCGVKALRFGRAGLVGAGRQIAFAGKLAAVPAQTVLTDFLVDALYPVEPAEGVEVVARSAGDVLGLHRIAGAGSVTYLGFRPRDDQAASLGYETRTWFEVLRAVGAYPKSRADVPEDDNPAVVSRTRPFLATTFPNGAICLAAHYRSHVESWGGSFHRDAKQDDEALARNPLPPDDIVVEGVWIAGHRIDYRGKLSMAFRLDDQQRLIAFAGWAPGPLTVDGREYHFAEGRPWRVAWAPIPETRRVAGGAILDLIAHGECRLQIPLPAGVAAGRLYRHGAGLGQAGEEVPATVADGVLSFANPAGAENHFYFVPGA